MIPWRRISDDGVVLSMFWSLLRLPESAMVRLVVVGEVSMQVFSWGDDGRGSRCGRERNGWKVKMVGGEVCIFETLVGPLAGGGVGRRDRAGEVVVEPRDALIGGPIDGRNRNGREIGERRSGRGGSEGRSLVEHR